MSPTYANEIRQNQKVPLFLSDLHNVDFEQTLQAVRKKKEGTDPSWLIISGSFQKAETRYNQYSEQAGRQALVTKSSTWVRFALKCWSSRSLLFFLTGVLQDLPQSHTVGVLSSSVS